MKKLTILEIEAVVKNDCPTLIAQIQELSRQMKDCREKILYYKKTLELEIKQFKTNIDDYFDFVTGKSLQNTDMFTHIKFLLDTNEKDIFETRMFLRYNKKRLCALRKQNSELFKKLLDVATKKATDIANDKFVCQQNKKIVLNYKQAHQVFVKLCDLFDSGTDFKKLTIEVG